MDGQRFDNLTRLLGRGSSRRSFLRGLAGAIAGGAVGAVGVGSEAAAATCRPVQSICSSNAHCCSGLCDQPDKRRRRYCVCPAGTEVCGKNCLASGALQTDPANCGKCGTRCTSGACVNGQCVKDLGTACSAGTECASGFCIDGVCCDGACDGQCQSCAGTGRCHAVSGAPTGGRSACGGSGTCTGTCDGRHASCVYPGADMVCATATCDAGVQTTHTCDGTGTCGATQQQNCGLYTCRGGACQTTCATNDDCIGVAYCANGVCTSDRGLGETCDGADQCQSGFCVDGVCCTVASCPDCEGCAAANAAGSCAPDPGTNGDTCGAQAGGVCQDGQCSCAGQGKKACGSVCLSADQCCLDEDCAGVTTDICNEAFCDQSTHTCQTRPATSDSRCVSDACANRSCTTGPSGAGICLNIPTFCSAGGVNTCQHSVGCDPNTGCLYESTCPVSDNCTAYTCVNAQCVETKTCGECQVCDPATGTCSARPDYDPATGANSCGDGKECCRGECVDLCCPKACPGTCSRNEINGIALCCGAGKSACITPEGNTFCFPVACGGYCGRETCPGAGCCSSGQMCCNGACVDRVPHRRCGDNPSDFCCEEGGRCIDQPGGDSYCCPAGWKVCASPDGTVCIPPEGVCAAECGGETCPRDKPYCCGNTFFTCCAQPCINGPNGPVCPA